MTAFFVAAVAGWWALLPEIAPKRIVVAVLPFDDGGAGANGASWLGDGIADDVRIALAQTPEFVVLESGASFAYRDRRHPFRALQDELGATHAVAGGARRNGDSLNVAARLIYLAETTTLWEDDWEGGMGDLFAIRDAIAQAVAQKLLLLGDAHGTAGPPVAVPAYEAFLRARALERSGDLQSAERLMRESLQHDASNPYAHAWLAQWLAGQDAAAALGHAQAALHHAPGFRDALAPVAWLNFLADGDAAQCFDALYELVQTNRDADAMRWLAELYTAGGRTGDAALLNDQLRRDPTSAERHAERFRTPSLPTSTDLANVTWRPASDLFADTP